MALSIVYRLTKGSPLTSAEHDANLHAIVTSATVGLDALATTSATQTAAIAANTTSIATNAAAIAAAPLSIMQTIYPVGSLYISTSATNPATILGFGTWVAYAAGRVLVGVNTTGTFNTLGATGGEETHTLLEAEIPQHTHNVPTPGVAGSAHDAAGDATGIPDFIPATPTDGGTGGGGAHNNIQPYITVSIWNRTV